MAFNLVDEPWLTVRPVGGAAPVARSLRQVLKQAHRLEGLVVDLPTQTPALLRQLLLPVVLDALGPLDTDAWRRRFRAGAFTKAERDQLDAYLDKHLNRFDLFHRTKPFAQVAGLHTAKGETRTAALIVATAATGNNVPLFSTRTEADPWPLTPAEVARWLLHTHCWDTAAIKTGAVGDPQAKGGKTTGNPTGPLGQLGVIVPTGRTLFETILLNLPIRPAAPGDRPQWRRPPVKAAWEERAATGLLDLWTWQSRRIRLVPEDTPTGLRVTRVIVAAGDRLRDTPDFEPHTAWVLPAPTRTSTPTGGRRTRPTSVVGAVRRPLRHRPGRAAWRGLDALLAREPNEPEPGQDAPEYATSVLLDQLHDPRTGLPADYPLQVELTGISYGSKLAVIEEVLFDSIPLPLTALTPESDSHAYEVLNEVAKQAEQLATAVNHLSDDLRHAAGGKAILRDRGQRPGELVLHAVDPLVRRLLAGVRRAGDDEALVERGQLAWEQLAWHHTRRIADQVISTAPPSTFAGRTEQPSDGTEPRHYCLARAEQIFRRQLRTILFREADRRRALYTKTQRSALPRDLDGDTADARPTPR